ncbi:MAG: Ig-like domain-containing protein, partial [Bacteroidetes bacterium]|nr:Ig-like domain-containing protein [Bacteroidota bacterium]
MDKKLQKIILKAILIILISGCANQLPPGGGDVDTTPPEIIEVYPVNGTTNYDDNYFELEFSEYVDKRSFKDALFISPYVEGKLEYEWTGTSVTVSFVDGLKKNVTYTITVGTDVVDRNNKNRMANSYSFSFSTGSKIDRRTIRGHVYSNQPEGVLIFAYKLDERDDTLLKRKPDYVSQTGKDGKFQLNGLGESKYRLFAIKDEYRDLIYDLDQDLIGMPHKDILLEGPDTSSAGVYFKLFKADTTAPRLLKSIMTDERHILTSVTEEIDKKLITSDNFYLIDSTTNQALAITHVFRKYGKNDEIVLVPAEKLDINNSVFLFADILRDTLGNEYLNDFISLTISDKPDTTSPNVIATDPSGR